MIEVNKRETFNKKKRGFNKLNVILLSCIGVIFLVLSANTIYEFSIITLTCIFSGVLISILLGTLLFIVLFPFLCAICVLYDIDPKFRDMINRVDWLRKQFDGNSTEEIVECN